MAKPKQTQLLVSPRTVLSLLLLLVAVNSAKAVSVLQVCGTNLNDALYAICQGSYAGFNTHKRASLDLFDYVEQQHERDNVVKTTWEQQLSSILATRRLNRGVVDECCLKACKISEIHAYCSS